METQQIYKLLRYSLQFIIIYLVLRYVPQIKLKTITALSVALLLTTMCVILEFVYGQVVNKQTDSEDCNTCANPPKASPNCRMVCDSEEHFAQVETNQNTKQINTVQSSQPVLPSVPIMSNEKPTVQQMLPVMANTPMTQPNFMAQPTISPSISPLSDSHNTTQPRQELVLYPSQGEQIQFPASGTTMDIPPFYLDNMSVADQKQEALNRKSNIERANALEQSAQSLNKMEHPYQTPGMKAESRKAPHYDARNDGNIENEMDYSDFDYNTLPVARGYKSSVADYGYSYLPPEAWFNVPIRAPVCVATRREPVFPSLSDGTPTDVKDFYIASRITGPMGISTEYINDKLNAGR
jgi:hypothetical protein